MAVSDPVIVLFHNMNSADTHIYIEPVLAQRSFNINVPSAGNCFQRS